MWMGKIMLINETLFGTKNYDVTDWVKIIDSMSNIRRIYSIYYETLSQQIAWKQEKCD